MVPISLFTAMADTSKTLELRFFCSASKSMWPLLSTGIVSTVNPLMLEEEAGSSQGTFVLGCSYENPPTICGGAPCESNQYEIIGFGGTGSEDHLIGIGFNQAGLRMLQPRGGRWRPFIQCCGR